MDAAHTLSSTDLLSCLQWRYAVKQFDPGRKIPADLWAALERATVLSPSSYGLQPWKFVVVQDAQIRQRLLPASRGQRKVVDSSHLVVFAARTTITIADVNRWLARLREIRHLPQAETDRMRDILNGDLVTGPRHAIAAEWAKRQTYLALGVFLASAAIMGIDTCPMEGFDPQAYDEILSLPARGYAATVIATAGYRSGDDQAATAPKVRYPVDEVILSL
jgi:nitroreductase